MPLYEFACENGHKFTKLMVRFPEENPKCETPKCKAKTEMLLSVPAKRDPRYGLQM